MQPEPLGLAGDINLYRYSRNNPLTCFDADARQATSIFDDYSRGTSSGVTGPFDVFIPGTHANNAFVQSINQIGQKIKQLCNLSNEEEDESFKQYERDLDYCDLFYKANGARWYAQCKKEAFGNYQRCRGYSRPE